MNALFLRLSVRNRYGRRPIPGPIRGWIFYGLWILVLLAFGCGSDKKPDRSSRTNSKKPIARNTPAPSDENRSSETLDPLPTNTPDPLPTNTPDPTFIPSTTPTPDSSSDPDVESPVQYAERHLQPGEAPAPVAAFFAREFPDGKVDVVETVSSDGTLQYQFSGKRNGRTGSGVIESDGRMVSRHDAIRVRDLPAGAARTLERECNGVPVDNLFRDTRPDGTIQFTAEYVKSGVFYELRLGTDGTILTGSGKETGSESTALPEISGDEDN